MNNQKKRKLDLPVFAVKPAKGTDEEIFLKHVEGWTRHSQENREFYYATTPQLTIFLWYRPGERLRYEFSLSDLAIIRLKINSTKPVEASCGYEASLDEIKQLAGGDTGTIAIKALKQLGLWRPFFLTSVLAL